MTGPEKSPAQLFWEAEMLLADIEWHGRQAKRWIVVTVMAVVVAVLVIVLSVTAEIGLTAEMKWWSIILLNAFSWLVIGTQMGIDRAHNRTCPLAKKRRKH